MPRAVPRAVPRVPRPALPPVLLVRRYPVLAFALLACVFGWHSYAFAAFGVGSQPENDPLGPVFAALVVTACQGRAALRAWGARLLRWGASPWLYVLAVLAPLAMHVAIVLINHAAGAPLPTQEQLSAWPQVPITFALMLVLVGIGEEGGWTAFAAPLLLRRHGLLAAWALLAGLRILWHLPLVLAGDMPWSVNLLGNAGFQLILLQLLRHRRGSWSLAAIWHATLNAFGGAFFFTMVTGPDRERLDLLLGVVYALVALATLVPGALRRPPNSGSAQPARSGRRPASSALR